jgi:hypothetical protein
VVECGLFEEAAATARTTLASQDLPAAESSFGQPTPAGEWLAETQQTEETDS